MEDLRRAQLLQLDLALEVKRICEKNHLRYFLIAGTLLGAVRHQGFIPWDDDLDIGLFRADYDRFLKACETDLDREKYFLQNWDTDSRYGLCFSKLRLNGTKYVEKNARHTQAHDGIYIDVFPFDCVPDEEALRRKQSRKTYLLKRLILAKQGYEVWQEGETAKKLIYGLLGLGAKLMSARALTQRLEREMQKYNGQATKKIVAMGGSYGYEKESVERRWLEETLELPFEGEMLACPKEYDAYLTYFYGDYMTPPPADKRGDRHQVKEIDFGVYGQ